jgi:hypothetical protein
MMVPTDTSHILQVYCNLVANLQRILIEYIVETAYFNRSLIVMCEYIVNKSANGLGGKNRGIVCREKIPQFVHIQLSFESCSIKSYSSYPVSQ